MSEGIFPRVLPYDLTPDDQLYFLHIAKTGGRSFEDLLKSNFPKEHTVRIDVPNGYPENIPSNVFHDYRLYLGHLGYYFLSLFPEDKKPFWITMLRDPVERVISYYYFFRNVKPVDKNHTSYQHQVLANTLSLLEFVKSDATASLVNNYQFNNLVDSEMIYYNTTGVKHKRSRSPVELVTLVKDRLQNECMFFGITEQYDKSIALLCYTFNWDLPTQPLTKLNVTPDKPSNSELMPEVIEAIRSKVDLDIEIYDFARELFKKRIDAMINHLLLNRNISHRDILSIGEDPHKFDNHNTPIIVPQNENFTLGETGFASFVNSYARGLYYKLPSQLQMYLFVAGQYLGLLKPPALFEPEWYLKQYPDVAKKKMNPYAHYKLWGWKERRSPGPGFDTSWYLSDNPDVLKSGMEPLDHYINYGIQEKRNPLPVDSLSQFHISQRDYISTNKVFNPKLCFHFPASPNDSFFSQIAMFRLSLNSLGGIYERADIVITLGDDDVKPLPERWKPHLNKNVKINWVDSELYRQHKYDAQSDAQWIYNHEEYDFICIVDADVMIIRPIDDLLFGTLNYPSLGGTIAHFPFPTAQNDNPQQLWLRLAHQFIQKPLEFGYRHTLSVGQPDEYTFCPFYINFGFILLTPEIIREISGTHLDIRPKVALKLEDPYFAAQTSLALTLAAHNIPVHAVGLRYNFPNDEDADHLHLNELRDVRLIHYLRTEQFDRQRIFTSQLEFDRFLSLELSGSNKIFQQYIRDLTNGSYPF